MNECNENCSLCCEGSKGRIIKMKVLIRYLVSFSQVSAIKTYRHAYQHPCRMQRIHALAAHHNAM